MMGTTRSLAEQSTDWVREGDPLRLDPAGRLGCRRRTAGIGQWLNQCEFVLTQFEQNAGWPRTWPSAKLAKGIRTVPGREPCVEFRARSSSVPLARWGRKPPEVSCERTPCRIRRPHERANRQATPARNALYGTIPT